MPTLYEQLESGSPPAGSKLYFALKDGQPVLIEGASGGGGNANVRWGPDFGQQGKPEVMLDRPTLPFLRVAAAVNVPTQARMDDVKIGGNAGVKPAQALNFSPGFSVSTAGQAVLSAIALSANEQVLAGARMDALNLQLSETAAAATSMGSVDVACDDTVANSLSITSLKAVANQVIGCQCSNTSNALSHSKTAGAHVSATVLGAPLYVDVGTYSSTSNLATGTFDVPVPASRQSGDLLLLMVGLYANASVINVPAGWTDLGGQFASGILKSRCFWKLSDGTEAATQNVTFVGSGPAVAEVHVVRAVSQSAPINVPAQITTANVTDPVAPSVTTTVANTLVFYWVVHDHNVLSQAHTPPASNTERAEHETSGIGVRIISGNSGSRYFAAAGATGTATIDCNELTASASVATRIAVAPGPLTLAT